MYTCKITNHYFRQMHSNSDQLVDHIMDIIMKNWVTRASTLRDATQTLIHTDIKYHTPHATRKRCVTQLDGSNKDLFYLISTHFCHILEQNTGAIIKYATPNWKFEMLFDCLSCSCHVVFTHEILCGIWWNAHQMFLSSIFLLGNITRYQHLGIRYGFHKKQQWVTSIFDPVEGDHSKILGP